MTNICSSPDCYFGFDDAIYVFLRLLEIISVQQFGLRRASRLTTKYVAARMRQRH